MRNCTSWTFSGVSILCTGQRRALCELLCVCGCTYQLSVTCIFIIGVYMVTSSDKQFHLSAWCKQCAPKWNFSQATVFIATYRDPFLYPVSWIWVTIFCTAWLQPWRCRLYIPPKHRYALTGLHDFSPRNYNQSSHGLETSELRGS
jgi:hypothetical protein